MELGDELQILGCQLRVPLTQLPDLWPASRREQFLLRRSTSIPLSADSGVWPTVTNDPVLSKLFEDYTGGAFEAPNGLNVFRLSDDCRSVLLDVLRDTQGHVISLSVQPEKAHTLIERHAITNVDDHNKRCCAAVGTRGLGYDVCDQTFVSLLMNCSVPDDVRMQLRSSFAADLNAHGLFDSANRAEAFSATMTRLVPEHAPIIPVYLAAIGQWV